MGTLPLNFTLNCDVMRTAHPQMPQAQPPIIIGRQTIVLRKKENRFGKI